MEMDPSSEQSINSTIAFYDKNVERFIEGTFGVDMTALYALFLERLPAHSHILDAGCGSGRDSLYFISKGYQVTAIDGSEEMAKAASRRIGQPVQRMLFHEIDFDPCFDGIWASASLLHVPNHLMDTVFSRFTRALKPGGIFYVSFKYGEGEIQREGRLFRDHNEKSFATFLERHPGLSCLRVLRDSDQRAGRVGEFWLNVILKKIEMD